jgi:hypothetical protein
MFFFKRRKSAKKYAPVHLRGALAPKRSPILSEDEALTQDATRVSEDLARAWDRVTVQSVGRT